MIDRIARALRIEPQQTRRALALGALLFTLSGSYTLVRTARDALFLAQLPASTLPYVYLGLGALTVVTAGLFARATRSRPTWESLEWAAWVAAISLAAFAYLFRLEARWVAVAFYVWVNLYGVILMSQFWAFTNSVSDPREARRIFGLIGVGGILGGLFAGAIASPLATTWSLSALLVVAAAMVGLVAPGVRAGIRRHGPPQVESAGEDRGTAASLARHRYVRLLAVCSLCSVLVSTLVDYQFKVEIQRRYPTPEALASFLGQFYVVTNLAALTMQVFVTRWSLRALGAGWSAAVLPGGLGVGAAVTMLVPGFASVLSTRIWDQVMRLSINKTATELFFFPLEPGLRRRVKALIEAGLERIGDALAGLIILAAGVAMGVGTQAVAVLVGGLVVIWVIAWIGVRLDYVVELGRNLRRMNLDHRHSTISLREASLLDEMTRLLESPFERVVLQGIEMLEENAPEQIQIHLERLLGHPIPAVRARAARLVGASRAEESRATLTPLLQDEDAEVRVEALRAWCALGGGDVIAGVEEFLQSKVPRLRLTALQCVAEYATAAEEALARGILERSLREGTAEERAAVAEALGHRAGASDLHDLIGPLLDDPASEVRNAALLSAGRAQRRGLVPRMIEALALRGSQAAARAGLTAFGEGVVGTLGDYLVDPSVPIEVRREIPRVLGAIGSQEAVGALFRHRERGDLRLAYRVLKAANKIRSRDAGVVFPARLVTEDLDHDVRSHMFVLVHYRACPIGEALSAERLLCMALNERMDQALSRIFRRLALLYSERDIYAAYRGVISENPRLRGNAMEYLENALAPEHRSLVLPLVDDSGDEARLRYAASRYGLRYLGYTESLEEILKGTDAWLMTCALYVVGKRGERALMPQVETHLASRDARVRETAGWVLAALVAG